MSCVGGTMDTKGLTGVLGDKWGDSMNKEEAKEIKEAFETLRDFCKSKVDGCSKCKFGIFNVKNFWECSLKVNYPCNWGEWENE